MKFLITITLLISALCLNAEEGTLLRVPPSTVTNAPAKTNMASGLVEWYNQPNTNRFLLRSNTPPPLARNYGDMFLFNSNGFKLYLLKSPQNSTAWATTNLIN